MLSIASPRSAIEAQQLCDARPGEACFVAGGTALQLDWPATQVPTLQLIDISALPEAQGISLQGDGWLRLGAATRLEALRQDALVRRHAPLLTSACDSLAALAVRHLATLGGNVGWRWGDTLAALLALAAQAELADGRRRPLAGLLQEPTLPLIVALWLDASAPPALALYEKIGLRAAFSPTRLALAFSGGLQKGRLCALRIAVSGAGLPARRMNQAERLLLAQPLAALEPEALQAACADDLAGCVDAASRARLAARLLAGHLGEDIRP